VALLYACNGEKLLRRRWEGSYVGLDVSIPCGCWTLSHGKVQLDQGSDLVGILFLVRDFGA
jgi:hypothetical protein